MSPTRRGFIAGTAALCLARPLRAEPPFVLRAASATLPLGDVALTAPALNGLGAGPLLEPARGAPFSVRVENALDFPLSFQVQGLRGKAIAGNDAPIAPGETREITLTAPDAGTFAYFLRGEDETSAARTALLAGPLIVGAETPPVADREAVLAVNTLVIPAADESAPPVRIATVNGTPEMKLAARPGARLRLRIANLAPEAVGGFRLPEGARIVALDGQPCPPFPPFGDVLFLPPFGRADIVLDTGDAPRTLADALDPAKTLVTVSPDGEAMPDRVLAEALPENPALPREIPMQAAKRVSWTAGARPPDPLLTVKSGESVVLTFENGAHAHALALEGHSARLLDALDDGWKPWWNDTLLVHPNETVRLAFVAAAPGRYALGLVPLEGAAAASRAWIVVT